MERQKLLIADANEEFRSALAEELHGEYCVKVCCDGRQALEHLRAGAADVLVLDLMLPEVDGLSLLRQCGKEGIVPQVVVFATYMNEYITQSLAGMRVQYIIMKPCDIAHASERICELKNLRVYKAPTHARDTWTAVTGLLRSLGIPSKLRGYTFLREAVRLYAEDPDQSITKELYPAVGAACSAAAQQVERSIRTAIEAGWDRGDADIWAAYFPLDKHGVSARPSNATFISNLAEVIGMEGPETRYSFSKAE